MARETLYWLGRGVLQIKDKDGKRESLEYGDVIPDGALTTERMKKLMKDGVIGERPKPVKASETARLKNRIKELEEKNTALKAGEGGKVQGHIQELEEKVTELTKENETLKSENEDLKQKVEDMTTDLEKLTKPGAGKDEKKDSAGSGVGPKGGDK